MAKRILPVCFVLVIGFLGLNFLAPSLSLVKTADAVTIKDLEVDDAGNFENDDGFYVVSFTTTSDFLTGGVDSIEIIFPGSFGFSSNVEVDDNNPKLDCDRTSSRVTCDYDGVGVIDSDTPIEIYISGVTNPSEGDYNLTINWTPAGSSTKSVTVQPEPPPSGGGGSLCSFSGGITSLLKNIGNCISNLPSAIGNFLAKILIGTIEFIIQMLVAVLLTIGALMVKAAVALSDFGPTSAARTGFDVTLGLTNIGFVLAIILIAFATIMQKLVSEGYTIKKALPRLIIIAILINFSWYFATTLIDISNALGLALMTMVGSVGGIPTSIDGIGDIGNMFKNAFSDRTDWSGIFAGSNVAIEAAADLLLPTLIGLLEALLQAVFGLVAFFALIATAFMLLLRYIMFTFLLVLMPLALLAYIFPGTSGKWKEWSHSFVKWLIIYPVLMFFLAIGFVAADRMLGTPVPNPITMMMNMLVVSGIMIGGLVAAQQMGLKGANFVNSLTSKTIRRIPANLAAMTRGTGKGVGKLFGRTGADGEPEAAPRSRLQFAGAPRGVPTPESLGERPEEPVTFADADRPYMQEEMGRLDREETPPTPEPTPTPAPEGPEIEDVEYSDNEPGRLRRALNATGRGIGKAGRGIESWSRGGDTTWDILKAGTKEVIGQEVGIFEGLYKGKSDNLKKAEKKLKEIHEKEFNLQRKITDAEEKLEKDAQAPASKQMSPQRRAEHRASIEVMKNKHLPNIQKEKPKAEKQIKKFGGNIKKARTEAGETERIYQEAYNRELQGGGNT